MAKQAVGILVRATLPGGTWICEGDAHAGRLRHAVVVRHFLALILGQRLAQQCRDGFKVAGGERAMLPVLL
jgi:hypothetical protein